MISAWGASQKSQLQSVKPRKLTRGGLLMRQDGLETKGCKHIPRTQQTARTDNFILRTRKRRWTVAMIGKYAITILGLYCRM